MAAKIKDGLFIGDEDTSKDPEFLDLNKISNLINVASKEINNIWSTHGLIYLNYIWEDRSDFNLFDKKEDILIDIIEFIDTSLRHGVSVLVFSKRGVGRCAVATMAYLMFKYHWGFEKTFAYVSSKKLDIDINDGFVYQLCVLDKKIREFRQKILKVAAIYLKLDQEQQETLQNVDAMRWKEWDISYIEQEKSLGLRQHFDTKFTQYLSTLGTYSKKDIRFMNVLKSASSDEIVLINSYNNSRSTLTTLPGPYLYAMAAPKTFRLKFNLEKSQVFTIDNLNISIANLNTSFNGRINGSSSGSKASSISAHRQQISTPTIYSPSATARPLRSSMKGSRLQSLQSISTVHNDEYTHNLSSTQTQPPFSSIINTSKDPLHHHHHPPQQVSNQEVVLDASNSPSHQDFLRYSSTFRVPSSSQPNKGNRESNSDSSTSNNNSIAKSKITTSTPSTIFTSIPSVNTTNKNSSIHDNTTMNIDSNTNINTNTNISSTMSSDSAEVRLAKLVRDIEQSRKDRHLRLTNIQSKQNHTSAANIPYLSSSSSSYVYHDTVNSPSHSSSVLSNKSNKNSDKVMTENPFAAATVSPQPSNAITNKILNGSVSKNNNNDSGSNKKIEPSISTKMTQNDMNQDTDSSYSYLYNIVNGSSPGRYRRRRGGSTSSIGDKAVDGAYIGNSSGGSGGGSSSSRNNIKSLDSSTTSPRRLSSHSNKKSPSTINSNGNNMDNNQQISNSSWLLNTTTTTTTATATNNDPYAWLLESNYSSASRSGKKGLSSSPRMSDESRTNLPTSVPKVYRHSSPLVTRISPKTHKLLSMDPSSVPTPSPSQINTSSLYSQNSPKNYSRPSPTLSSSLNALIASEKEPSHNRVFFPKSSVLVPSTKALSSSAISTSAAVVSSSLLNASKSQGRVATASASGNGSSSVRSSSVPRTSSPRPSGSSGANISTRPKSSSSSSSSVSPRSNNLSTTSVFRSSGNYGEEINDSYSLAKSSIPTRVATISRDTTNYNATATNASDLSTRTSIPKLTRSATPTSSGRNINSDSSRIINPSRSSSARSMRPTTASVDTQSRDTIKMNLNASNSQLRVNSTMLSSSLRPGTPSRIWR